uniref:Uncharacterized protein n=1 Tax=Tanacetum cinerariifolium TaxID=118510 RepID=A0A6L2LUH5_TANCI|nr:hypothetical protein [Tanacetum cinerariifolium]
MGDENPIRTFGDYSKPSHEGYRNTIELPAGNMCMIHHHMGGSYYSFPCSILSTGKDCKTSQRYPDVLTTSWRISIRIMDSFQGLTTKSHSSWNQSLAQSPNFYDHVNPVTRRTIDQSQDEPLTNRLVYYMKDLEQAFVEYASSHTDKARGLVSNFVESQDARLTKFEADFKQQQSEITNKIDTILKAITDRIARTLPSDTIKNPKMSTSLVLSARSYPTMEPQCSTHVHGSINAVTIHSKKQSNSYYEEKENEEKEKRSPENIHVNPSTPPDPSVTFITKKVLKFNSFFKSLGLVPQTSNTKVVCTKEDDGEIMFIESIRKNDDSSKREPKEEGSTTTEGVGAEYFDIFPTRNYVLNRFKFLARGWHLEEIHMTWAHLEKKRTKLRTCTKIHQEVLFSERGNDVSGITRRRRDLSGDGLRKSAFVCIAVDTSRKTRVRKKDTVGLVVCALSPHIHNQVKTLMHFPRCSLSFQILSFLRVDFFPRDEVSHQDRKFRCDPPYQEVLARSIGSDLLKYASNAQVETFSPLVVELQKLSLQPRCDPPHFPRFYFKKLVIALNFWQSPLILVHLPVSICLKICSGGDMAVEYWVPKPGYCWNDDDDCECCDDGVDGFAPISCWYDEFGLRRLVKYPCSFGS